MSVRSFNTEHAAVNREVCKHAANWRDKRSFSRAWSYNQVSP